MIDVIIFLILWLVITEIFYFKVALKYDIFGGARERVEIKGKYKYAYGLYAASIYKTVSLMAGLLIICLGDTAITIIKQNIIETLIALVVFGVVLIFFWINWVFTKRRQGNIVPDKPHEGHADFR